MSAIAGLIHTDGRPVEAGALEAMASAFGALASEGTERWRDGPAGMVSIRWSTTAEAGGDRQPVPARSGRVICFDGRIDNRDELLGALPADTPDSVLLLALFDALGDACLDRLVGDYALAIWDPARRRLFCARSPLGWRPLLWTRDRGRFGFASEPRALIDGLELRPGLNMGVVGEYLSNRFVSQTETFWTGIHRLTPGSALSLEGDNLRIWHWFDGPFEDLSRLSEADHIERFNALFDQALASTTRGHHPVSAQLSGGLDSSSIVCRADELHRAGRIANMPNAFSARFPGQPQDEGDWIAEVEAKLGIRTQAVLPRAFDMEEAKAWCADTLQLPLRPNSLTTIAGVCDAVRASGSRVLLTGEGGDDWMAGTYAHWPDLVRSGRWIALAREAASIDFKPSTRVRMVGEAFGAIISARRRHKLLRPHLDFDYAAPAWINPEWARSIDLSDRWRGDAPLLALSSYAQQQRAGVLTFARRYINADGILAYAARSGVELRHPFHDLRLVRFFLGASGRVLRRGGERKHLLREAMRGTLPEAVRTRFTKANFTGPMIEGVEAVLRERGGVERLACVREGWVDGAHIAMVQDDHRKWWANGMQGTRPAGNYGPVWNAVGLDLWLENAFKH